MQQEYSTSVIDALAEGFRLVNPRLNAMCRLALLSIGAKAAIRLQTIADEPGTYGPFSRRLMKVVKRIEDFPDNDACVGDRVARALLDSIRATDQRLNDKAMAAFRSISSGAIDMLIDEAYRFRRSFGYCAKLLKTVDSMEARPDITRVQVLYMLSFSKNETIKRLTVALVQKFH